MTSVKDGLRIRLLNDVSEFEGPEELGSRYTKSFASGASNIIELERRLYSSRIRFCVEFNSLA